MRHRNAGRTLGRNAPHRRALFRNLTRALFEHGRIITTVAGSGKAGFSGDGGAAEQATMNQPHSIQFDARGDLYICDILNHRIRKVDMKTGVITTFAGTGEKGPTVRFSSATAKRIVSGL